MPSPMRPDAGHTAQLAALRTQAEPARTAALLRLLTDCPTHAALRLVHDLLLTERKAVVRDPLLARLRALDPLGILVLLGLLGADVRPHTPPLRHAILEQLATGWARVREILLSTLTQGDALQQRGAILALRTLGDQEDLAHLCPLARHPSVAVRFAVMEALADAGDPTALNVLTVTAEADGSVPVRNVAAASLVAVCRRMRLRVPYVRGEARGSMAEAWPRRYPWHSADTAPLEAAPPPRDADEPTQAW